MKNAVSFISGLLFALGLVVGGMTQPEKIVGFLDISGSWDPSLLLVMASAIAVYWPLYQLAKRRRAPVLARSFALPTRKDLDPRLIGGGVLFGAGWGLAGYCPGPGVVSLATGAASALTFVAAMLIGMGLYTMVNSLRARRVAAQSA